MESDTERSGNFAKRFEGLRIWRESRELVRDIYREFSGCRDYSFRDQIQRAALSIMNNTPRVLSGAPRRTSRTFLTSRRGTRVKCEA